MTFAPTCPIFENDAQPPPAHRSISKPSSVVELSTHVRSMRLAETTDAMRFPGAAGLAGGGGAAPNAPFTTSANGCGPLGTLYPRTVTLHVPAAADAAYTFSRLFTRSAVPPVWDHPPAKTLPRYWVPFGAVTTRSRSLTRVLAADVVDAKSLQASVTLKGEPSVPTVYV